MNLLIFQNRYEFQQFFFYFYENTVFEKNWDYNLATVSSTIQKILVHDMESCYKKIRNVTSIFPNFQKFFKNVRKKLKNSNGIWKINKFVWNKKG